jgi:hypothetical protein
LKNLEFWNDHGTGIEVHNDSQNRRGYLELDLLLLYTSFDGGLQQAQGNELRMATLSSIFGKIVMCILTDRLWRARQAH